MNNMETVKEEINIESIMTQIRQESRKKKYQEKVHFEDNVIDTNHLEAYEFDAYKLDDDVYTLNGAWHINVYQELTGNKVKVFFKRICRRLVLFFIERLFDDQNCFNAQTVRVINEMNLFVCQTEEKNEALKREIVELREEVQKLRSTVEAQNENSNH